jgi:hypothetical protein
MPETKVTDPKILYAALPGAQDPVNPVKFKLFTFELFVKVNA